MNTDAVCELGGRAGTPVAQVSGPTGMSAGKQVSVYVVDDERIVGELVETFLKLRGYQTRLFVEPKLALESLVGANPPPLVLVTDYAMEGLDGLQLIERCRQRHPGLKTILISGRAGEELLEQSPVKPDCFLRKPFLSSQLVGAMQSVLDR